MDEQQKRLEAFLASSAAFRDGTRTVKVVTTHGAKIFIGETDVYKIKRPVDLGYMDFTSLDKREAVCRNEIKLNRDAAPSIYVDVTPITRAGGGDFAINGSGEVVEWAVHMKRYPEENVLIHVAREGRLDKAMSAQLGQQVASQHMKLPPLEIPDGGNRMKSVLDGLLLRLGDERLRFPRHTVQSFGNAAREVLHRISGKLDRRSELGMIRRCHGDLHLANIVLLDGKPVPVDALEFNEEFATTDVLYDLAFLLMDLVHNQRKDAANQVLNRYCLIGWELVKDHGFEVLPLLIAVRSAVRSMVQAQRMALDEHLPPGKESEATAYLEQAIQYLLSVNPKLFAVGGLSGTGKSTLASDLAPKLEGACGALVLRSDLERKAMFGVREFEKLPEAAYRQDVSEKVYSVLLEKARVAITQGQPVLLDAVFANTQEQQAALELGKSLGVPFTGLWLDAPEDVLVERVRNRHHDASDADETVVRKQISWVQNANSTLPECWASIDASKSASETLNNAISVLNLC